MCAIHTYTEAHANNEIMCGNATTCMECITFHWTIVVISEIVCFVQDLVVVGLLQRLLDRRYTIISHNHQIRFSLEAKPLTKLSSMIESSRHTYICGQTGPVLVGFSLAYLQFSWMTYSELAISGNFGFLDIPAEKQSQVQISETLHMVCTCEIVYCVSCVCVYFWSIAIASKGIVDVGYIFAWRSLGGHAREFE